MEPINAPLLSCDDILSLLDKPKKTLSPEERQILRDHLASCAACRAEARLRLLLQQSAEEPPAGLTGSVMDAIRAERARAALRLRRIRRIGTVAAAAVLIPAVVILAPILLRTGKSITSVPTCDSIRAEIGEEEKLLREPETSPETAPALLFSTMLPTPEDEGDAVQNSAAETVGTVDEETQAPLPAPTSPSEPAPEENAVLTSSAQSKAADPVGAAPEYVGHKSPSAAERQTSPSTMAAEAPDSSSLTEDPFFSVVRDLVGEDVLNEWLLYYNGPEEELYAALCADLAISREKFLTQAAHRSISFPEETLDRLFPKTEIPAADR